MVVAAPQLADYFLFAVGATPLRTISRQMRFQSGGVKGGGSIGLCEGCRVARKPR